ncbi:hypothetical protein TSUD_172610 [Trifolium subterraneum]|uniref:Uncharacterized protein n=1 Tax=Trifolium subterraneum TaxID=3900 RepID=A0A2Z6LZX6_TRISU|nr:hypothetical protein TSUD_172610 [Trifolium subterraneum]
MLPTPQRVLVIPALKLRATLLAWSTTMRRRHGDVVVAKDVVEEVVASTKALGKVSLPVKSVLNLTMRLLTAGIDLILKP